MKNFIRAFRNCYINNYVNFRGKTDRRVFWTFAIGIYILAVLLSMFLFIAGDSLNSLSGGADFMGKIGIGLIALVVIGMALFLLSLPIPLISAIVRRLRDANMSPNWVIWLFILPTCLTLIYHFASEEQPLAGLFDSIQLVTRIILIIFLARPSKECPENLQQ